MAKGLPGYDWKMETIVFVLPYSLQSLVELLSSIHVHGRSYACLLECLGG